MQALSFTRLKGEKWGGETNPARGREIADRLAYARNTQRPCDEQYMVTNWTFVAAKSWLFGVAAILEALAQLRSTITKTYNCL